MSDPKLPTSFKFSQRSKDILDALSEFYGINRTAVLEMLIRDKAREEGILTGTPHIGPPK